MNVDPPECEAARPLDKKICKCLKIKCINFCKEEGFFECLAPDNLELTDSTAPAKKQDTRDQYLEWRIEAIRLAKTRRYKNRLDICRAIKERIDLDDGVSVTAEHICRSIKFSDSDFKKSIENSIRKKLILNK